MSAVGRPAEGPIEAEVVVIGGGIAGAAAALAARRRGRRVALLRRSWGATALSHGLFDLAPDPLATPRLPRGESRPIGACIRALAALRPDHPWALLADRLGAISTALGAAQEESGGRLRFAALEAENRCFLTPLGTIKTSAGALDSVMRGDLLGGGRIGVVGLDHPAYDAALLADSLREAARAAGISCSATPIECHLLRSREDFGLHPHRIAARIEADPDAFAEAIRGSLRPGVDRLLLPPLLGSGDPGPILEWLERVLGLPCAEIPAASTAPLPGLRLQRLLDGRLAEAGVAVFAGEAVAPDGTPESLSVRSAAPELPDPALFAGAARPGSSASTGASARPAVPVRARAVVLATGRFVGGGIAESGRRLVEPVFGLPIETGAGEGAPFRAGVRVDGELRPRAAPGGNLYACGSILAGNDPATDGAGLGLSWCTGWMAGLAAARHGGG